MLKLFYSEDSSCFDFLSGYLQRPYNLESMEIEKLLENIWKQFQKPQILLIKTYALLFNKALASSSSLRLEFSFTCISESKKRNGVGT